MAITKITTPDLIDLPFNNTDGVVLAKGTTSVTAIIDYLVIAGGGGGGSTGGGGGAGGYRNSFNNESSGGGGSSETNLIASVGVALDIEVGDGGAGSTSPGGGVPGVNGTNSTFSTIVSIGGGGGGSNPSNDGEDGGSGGGTSAATGTGKVGGTGTANQGFDGGKNALPRTPAYGGGGGGGAGAVGVDGLGDRGGNGGVGLESNITNTPTFRAGGGGGGRGTPNIGVGGTGGGGNGTLGNTTAGSATVNTGGGGGGGGYSGGFGNGGAGGSGVIILRTPSNTTAVFSGGVTANGSTGGSIAPDTSTGDNVWIVTATTNSTQTVTFSATGDGTGRPTTNLSDGEFRYNTTTKKVEFYDGAAWFALTSTTAVPQAGTTGTCNYPTTATALYQLDNDVINSCNNVGATPVGITYSTTEKKFGTYSAVFSGSSSYITTPIDFSTFTNYSVSMWIYPTATGAGTATGTGFGGTVDAGTDYGFFLSINSSNQIRFYERTGSPVTALTSSNAVTLNTWNNIVAIRDGSTKYIYVNNTVTSLNTNTTITHTSDFIFGRAGLYASDSYTGNIDQARIFPSALTSAQVTALYTETAP